MADKKVKKPTKINIQRVDPRYITYNEDIYHALDIFERSVYQALRYEADYSQEQSKVEMGVLQICEVSKVGKTKTHQCLNSLEYKHFLIKRINIENFKYGKLNDFMVASRLNYFKPIDQELSSSPSHEPSVQDLTTRPPHELGSSPHELGSSPHGHVYTINTYINSSIRTTVVVVNPSVTQKLLNAFNARSKEIEGIETEEDILSACQHWIDIRPTKVSAQGRANQQIKFIKDGSFYPHEDWLNKNKKQSNQKQKTQNKHGLTEEEIDIAGRFKHSLNMRKDKEWFGDPAKYKRAKKLCEIVYNVKL